MMHVYGDPLKYRDLESKISVERFNSAIILCDAAWVDPDQVLSLMSAGFQICLLMREDHQETADTSLWHGGSNLSR